MPTAVTYCRYSSHNQTEQSIEGQLHDNYAFAAREGYTIVHDYIDRARTGKYDNRDEFQQMIQDAAKMQFQYIIVWKFDRFARNRYDSAIYKSKLKKYGVKVISAMEAITDTPEGIILEGLLESMAEYYSANLSVNVKRGLRETLAKERFAGGQIPFGYRLADGKLLPHEQNAPVVRYVFEQYAAGVPKKRIIDHLRARGVRAPNGGELTVTTFGAILKNPLYYGCFIRGGMQVSNVVTPLITMDLFEQVQRRLAANARSAGATKSKVDYLLSGKMLCGYCGSPIVGESGRGKMGEVYHYYACSAKKKLHTCAKKNEKKEDLESFVLSSTFDYILQPAVIDVIADAVVEEYGKEFSNSRLSALEKDLKRLEKEMEKAVDALIDAPKAARARISERIDTLDTQMEDLKEDIVKMRISSRVTLTREQVVAWLSAFCTPSRADPSFIIDTFINCVYVYDDHCVIYYNLTQNAPIAPPPSPFSPSTVPRRSRKSPRSSSTSTPPDSTSTPPDPESNPSSNRAPSSNPSPPIKSSTGEGLTLPIVHLSEHVFIFLNNVFGCIFGRENKNGRR